MMFNLIIISRSTLTHVYFNKSCSVVNSIIDKREMYAMMNIQEITRKHGKQCLIYESKFFVERTVF